MRKLRERFSKLERNKKRAIIIAGTIILLIVFFQTIRGCGSETKAEYEYINVDHGKVRQTISVTGNLEVMDSYHVITKTTGIVKRVYVDFNERVKKGQLLAYIDASDVTQNLNKLKAQLESARLELQVAKEDLETKKNMLKENLVSQMAVEQAEIKYKSVELQLKQIKIDYNQLSQRSSYSRLTSPVPGVIISRNIEENVPVAMNTPVFEIASNMTRMRLLINIDESDIGKAEKGLKVTFTVSAYPEKTFSGEIAQVRMKPILQGNIVTYQAVVICDNSELLLKPGMTATATVIVEERENVLRVPNQTFMVSPVEITYEKGKKFVWKKLPRGKGDLPVERIEVKTGLEGDDYTEILNPLKENDEILYKYTRGGK